MNKLSAIILAICVAVSFSFIGSGTVEAAWHTHKHHVNHYTQPTAHHVVKKAAVHHVAKPKKPKKVVDVPSISSSNGVVDSVAQYAPAMTSGGGVQLDATNVQHNYNTSPSWSSLVGGGHKW